MTCAEGSPPPLRARGKAGRGVQFEQGDEGGGLECGKFALGGLFLEVIQTAESPLFPCTFGENMLRATFGVC